MKFDKESKLFLKEDKQNTTSNQKKQENFSKSIKQNFQNKAQNQNDFSNDLTVNNYNDPNNLTDNNINKISYQLTQWQGKTAGQFQSTNQFNQQEKYNIGTNYKDNSLQQLKKINENHVNSFSRSFDLEFKISSFTSQTNIGQSSLIKLAGENSIRQQQNEQQIKIQLFWQKTQHPRKNESMSQYQKMRQNQYTTQQEMESSISVNRSSARSDLYELKIDTLLLSHALCVQNLQTLGFNNIQIAWRLKQLNLSQLIQHKLQNNQSSYYDLYMRDRPIDVNIFTSCKWEGLICLYMGYCNIDDLGWKSFVKNSNNYKSLKVLGLSMNKITTTTDQDYQQLLSNTQINTLYIRGNQLLPESIISLKNFYYKLNKKFNKMNNLYEIETGNINHSPLQDKLKVILTALTLNKLDSFVCLMQQDLNNQIRYLACSKNISEFNFVRNISNYLKERQLIYNVNAQNDITDKINQLFEQTDTYLKIKRFQTQLKDKVFTKKLIFQNQKTNEIFQQSKAQLKQQIQKVIRKYLQQIYHNQEPTDNHNNFGIIKCIDSTEQLKSEFKRRIKQIKSLKIQNKLVLKQLLFSSLEQINQQLYIKFEDRQHLQNQYSLFFDFFIPQIASQHIHPLIQFTLVQHGKFRYWKPKDNPLSYLYLIADLRIVQQ